VHDEEGNLNAHVDISVEDLSSDVGVRSVPLVDSKDTDDELSGREEGREGSGWEVGREEGLSLRLVGLLLNLELEGRKEETERVSAFVSLGRET